MKKFIPCILLFIAFTFSSTIFAQNQIPNNDFESWTSGEPTNWDTSNENILGTDFVTVTRDQSNPYSGTASAKVATVTQNIFLVGPVTMPGILTLGDVVIDIMNQTGTVVGGVPVTGQPRFLKGYYKYQPGAGDSCYMGIGLTRWNGNSRDTLAYAYKPFGSAVTTWTEFSVPIDYVSWAEPDSMNIMFVSSNLMFGSPVTGSTLWVDSLWLEYSGVAVKDIGLDKSLFVSTANDGRTLVVNVKQGIARNIEVFALSGSLISSITGAFSNSIPININNLKKGVYIVRVTFTNGTTKAVKFSRI